MTLTCEQNGLMLRGSGVSPLRDEKTPCRVLHQYIDIARETVYDVLQNQLDDIRQLRRVFGHVL